MTAAIALPEDVHAVSSVLFNYATAIDTKNWQLFRTCFHPECRTVYNDQTFEGVDELTNYMEHFHRYLDSSLHRVSNIEVRSSVDELTAHSYVDALLVRQGHNTRHVAGTYQDHFVRNSHDWVISRRVFVRVWSEGSLEITR